MKGTMHALVKKDSISGIWMEKVPVPVCEPNDVLIKNKNLRSKLGN